MKKIAMINLALLASVCSHAQMAQPAAKATMEVNNLKVSLRNGGDLFSDSLQPGIMVKLPGQQAFKSVVYSTSLWMGGIADNESLHLSAISYRQNGFEYYPGPISNDSVSTSHAYNKIWSVTSAEIEEHKLNPGSHANINAWPAIGNTEKHETPFLAPFIDKNHNKMYEPSQGDFPKINGNMMSYMVYNDNGYHEESFGTNPLKIEVQNVVFAYDLPGTLSNTLFFQYKLTNKSSNTYKDFYAGLFSDFDLGDYSDDYVGCDTMRNMYFVYNAYNIDGGIDGFGENPPAAGFIFLNKKMDVFKATENSMSNTIGIPEKPEEFYEILKGNYKNGAPMRDRYNNHTTKQYYGDVADVNEYNMRDKMPTDSRGFSSIGPLVLAPGEEICIDMAFVVATGKDNFDAVKVLQKSADEIQHMYNTKQLGTNTLLCAPNFVSSKDLTINAKAYPNPAVNKITFEWPQQGDFELRIIGVEGKVAIVEKAYQSGEAIDISTLPKGVYLAIFTDGVTTYKEKFFKN